MRKQSDIKHTNHTLAERLLQEEGRNAVLIALFPDWILGGCLDPSPIFKISDTKAFSIGNSKVQKSLNVRLDAEKTALTARVTGEPHHLDQCSCLRQCYQVISKLVYCIEIGIACNH